MCDGYDGGYTVGVLAALPIRFGETGNCTRRTLCPPRLVALSRKKHLLAHTWSSLNLPTTGSSSAHKSNLSSSTNLLGGESLSRVKTCTPFRLVRSYCVPSSVG